MANKTNSGSKANAKANDTKENKKIACSDAMLRGKKLLKEKLERVSAAKKQKGGKKANDTRKTICFSPKTEKPKGKSYKSAQDRELKEKDPNSKKIQLKRLVLDTKPGGRNRRSNVLNFNKYLLIFFTF